MRVLPGCRAFRLTIEHAKHVGFGFEGRFRVVCQIPRALTYLWGNYGDGRVMAMTEFCREIPEMH